VKIKDNKICDSIGEKKYMLHQTQRICARTNSPVTPTTLKRQAIFILHLIKMEDPRRLLFAMDFLIRNLKRFLDGRL
jgi:hypothetical protein